MAHAKNHDYHILPPSLWPFLAAPARVDVVSIGHALIDEALYEGFETTVRRYVHTVERLPAA